jgi:hypothetical protein
MSVTIQQTTIINASTDTNLTASQIASASPATSGGIVIAGSNFSGNILTLQSGFADALYAILGSPTVLNTSYPVTFSCGYGNSFIAAIADTKLIYPDSTTFAYNYGYVSGTCQPTVMFVLTNVANNEFTIYG